MNSDIELTKPMEIGCKIQFTIVEFGRCIDGGIEVMTLNPTWCKCYPKHGDVIEMKAHSMKYGSQITLHATVVSWYLKEKVERTGGWFWTIERPVSMQCIIMKWNEDSKDGIPDDYTLSPYFAYLAAQQKESE